MNRRRFCLLSCLASSLALFPFSANAAAPQLQPFKQGQTIGFLGDSITARGQLQTYLATFYHTRFPDLNLKFVNAGRSGDTAGGALQRMEDDLLQHQPNVVFLMMGMNDVGRSNYVPNPTPKQLEAQKASLDRYQANMTQLVDRVLAAPSKPQIVFVTPSPFDETLKQELQNNQPGCNEALAKCAAFVRELAQKHQAPVVEFHSKLTTFNLEQQKKDPAFTIVGPDRVHMGPEGYLMCSWIVLKQQGVNPLVNAIEIRVEGDRANLLTVSRARVQDLKKETDSIRFKVDSNSLPFPMPKDTERVQKLAPIAQDLNQETLKVEGLGAGTYELLIDGVVITRQDASAWAKGVDLSAFAATPQYQQALKVAEANEKRRAAESEALVLLNARRRIAQQHRIDPDDREAVEALYANAPDKSDYHIAMTKRYLERWSEYPQIRQTVVEADAEANRTKKPLTRQYELKKVP